MSFAKAINEIASLLTQGGAPANHAQDVAARLSYALEDYYNYRLAQGNKNEVDASSGNNSAFRDAFRPQEDYPGGSKGDAGKDGEWAWAVGQDGKDGEDGTGQDGTSGQDGTNGTGSGGGGGGTPDISKVPCRDLKKKLKDCGVKTGTNDPNSCGSGMPDRYYDPVCCRDGGGTFRGQGVCDILKQQANQLKKITDRLDAIEKILKDTVDCP